MTEQGLLHESVTPRPSSFRRVTASQRDCSLMEHDALAAAAVIGTPDDQCGEVHAVVVRRPNATVSAEELQRFCAAVMAQYKVPRSVAFVDALPTSAAGKVLKRTLREPYWEGRARNICSVGARVHPFQSAE
jgi:acyl-CoA synthetase (AMP-forming)/AMP-acid ligase II